MKSIQQGVILLSLLLCLSQILFSGEPPQIISKHFSFNVSGSVDTGLVRIVADALESNYSRISGDLQTIPYDPIEVNLYSAQWRYFLATGNWFASGSIEGPAKLHFVVDDENRNGIGKVALHEFAHAVFLKLLIDSAPQPFDRTLFDAKYQTLPVWLWEAVSVFEAGQFKEPRSLAFLNNGSYPGLAELNNRSSGKIYSCGFTIIEYILHTYGKEKLIALMTSYGNVKKTLSVTEEEFSRDWYAFIRTKYLQ